MRGKRFLKLNLDNLKIIALGDAPFANNADLSSHLGHIVGLTYDSRRGNALTHGSYKSKQVVRSVFVCKT